MSKEEKKKLFEDGDKKLPEYESPKVLSYGKEDLLKELGPAKACSPFVGSVIGC